MRLEFASFFLFSFTDDKLDSSGDLSDAVPEETLIGFNDVCFFFFFNDKESFFFVSINRLAMTDDWSCETLEETFSIELVWSSSADEISIIWDWELISLKFSVDVVKNIESKIIAYIIIMSYYNLFYNSFSLMSFRKTQDTNYNF